MPAFDWAAIAAFCVWAGLVISAVGALAFHQMNRG